MVVDNTPLEIHRLFGVPVIVKREDLCAPTPGPTFSKMRGVMAHIKSRPEPVIGVLDTLHSKAGWAVAAACVELGKTCVDYWPQYKRERDSGASLRTTQLRAREFGAELVALPAGRSAVLYHSAKKHLAAEYGVDGYMMPNALKLPESITENAAEAIRTAAELPRVGTLVFSISSGTVAAGVLRGLTEASALRDRLVVLHMGYSRSQASARAYMERVGGITLGPDVMFVDEGYGYADPAPKGASAPFPCNPYYDLKAWHWLGHNLGQIPTPIVFWNIGD